MKINIHVCPIYNANLLASTKGNEIKKFDGGALHTHTIQTYLSKSFSYTQRVQRKGEEENSLPCKIVTATKKEIERSRIGETYKFWVPMIEGDSRKKKVLLDPLGMASRSTRKKEKASAVLLLK